MSSDTRSLFRPEAVAYHERGLGPGNLLRHSAWVGWGWWVALVGVVGVLTVGLFVRVSPSLTASVSSSSSPDTAVLTAPARTPLPQGSSVTLGTMTGHVVAVSPGPVSGTYTLRVLLDDELAVGAAPSSRAVVHLPPKRLIVMLARGFLGD